MTDKENDCVRSEVGDFASAFMRDFPEFSSFPRGRIEMVVLHAFDSVCPKRFGRETAYARQLYVAHTLAVLGSGISGDGTANGASPKGAIASKAVGSVSVSYDTGSASETDAGYWNATAYGRLYWQLLRRHRVMPRVVFGRSVFP